MTLVTEVLLVICRNVHLEQILSMDMATNLVVIALVVESVIIVKELARVSQAFSEQDVNTKLLSINSLALILMFCINLIFSNT